MAKDKEMAKDKTFWDSLIDTIQVGSLAFVILVVFLCVLTLILFDVLVGAGTMIYLTNNQMEASVVISMATTGLLVALMMVAHTALTKGRGAAKSLGWLVVLAAGGVYVMDVVFDSLAADVLRYGEIVALNTLPDKNVQLMFRILLGGISTIGESLAVAIILGMPVLKEIVRKALPKDVIPSKPNTQFIRPINKPFNKYDPNKKYKMSSEIEEKLKQHRIN